MAKEEVIGIPSLSLSHELPKITKPTKFEYVIHDHHAERRGRHFDLRLGDPSTGYAHSWAIPPSMPAPGKASFAIQQPTHTVSYMDFKGRLGEGYGKGDVHIQDRDKVEIVKSEPGHIAFNLYKASGPQEFVLHQIGGKIWKLFNRTFDRQTHPNLPSSKPDYKEISVHDAPKKDGDYIMSVKIDDAHNLFYFPKAGEQVRVFSYRPSKRSPTGLIEHTHKVPVIREGLETPSNLGGTIIRGGLYAIHPETGKATPAKDLASLLNTDVWKSREKQKQLGELIPVLYDVIQYRGKNVEKVPYKEKLEILQKVERSLPHVFHLPRMARTEEDKKKLITDLKSGNLPESEEGVVLWNLNKSEPPIKAKFTKEHDVYIRGFFPGEGKYKDKGVGGFLFSHDPLGPIVGRVGTGLTDEQRVDMHKNSKNYMGIVARVKAMDKYTSGALRAPSFQGYHLDKNEQISLQKLKMASVDFRLVFIWGNAIS